MSSELERRLTQLGIDSKTFNDLEEEFQKVIKELSGDASMERFRREFEKLHKALKDSNEREKELIKACRQAADSILHETVGMDSIVRITQEDDNKIRRFQTELENAQKYIRQLKETEEKQEARLHELNNAMLKLEEDLKNSKSITNGRTNEISDLKSKRDELYAKKLEADDERKRLEADLKDLKDLLDRQKFEKEQLETNLLQTRDKVKRNSEINSECELNKAALDQKLEQKKKEKSEANAEKAAKEEERKNVKIELVKNEKKLLETKHDKQQLDTALQRLEKEEIELKKKENDQIAMKMKLDSQTKEKQMEHDKLAKALLKVEKELKKEGVEYTQKQDDLQTLSVERDHFMAQRDILKTKVYQS